MGMDNKIFEGYYGKPRLMPRRADVETAVGDTGYNFMLGGFNSQHTKSQPAATSSARREIQIKESAHCGR
jgi:hypothetical protein